VEGCYGSGDTPQDVARTAKNKRFSTNEIFWRVFVSMYIWPVAGAGGHQCFITLNVSILKANSRVWTGKTVMWMARHGVHGLVES
jgi:hypothetical protein